MNKYQELLDKYKDIPKQRSELIGYEVAQTNEQPHLPRCYIVGDSISISYTEPVRKKLAGFANVIRPPYNCKTSEFLKSKLEEMFNIGKIDVCSLNVGIHDTMSDRFVPIENYRYNLKQIVEFIATRTQVFWVTTTRFFGPPRLRPLADSFLHNDYCQASKEVMQQIGIDICNLEPFINTLSIGNGVKDDGMHFTPESYEKIGDIVAQEFQKRLPEPIKIL